MSYKHTNSRGITYFLNSKVVDFAGKPRPIYFFSKDERAETAADLPDTHEVVENARNAFLALKKKV